MPDAAAVPALRQFPPPPQPAPAQQPPLPVPITTPKEVGVVARRARFIPIDPPRHEHRSDHHSDRQNDRQRDDHDSRGTHTAGYVGLPPSHTK